MEDVLHLQLFGNLRLSWGAGAAIAIQSPRLETLLAYLVLHRTGPQPRAYLAFILWPDSSEAQALSNLRNLLTRLRQLTPGMDRYIESSRTDVSWRSDAPLRLDVLELEALARKPLTPDTIARALDLYTADLLPAH